MSILQTGIPNLDVILGEGIPKGDVLLVIGMPGSGKTTISLQMAFHAASSGQNVLYISTLSGLTTRLLNHIRAFSFYNESLISKQLSLSSLYTMVNQSVKEIAVAIVGLRGELYRIISIIKMRDTAHDHSIRQYDIADQGIKVLGKVESAEGVLTGIVRLASQERWKRGMR